MVEKLTPMSEDFNQWYTDIVQQAELADYAPVKGTMVIRPYGYSIWEGIQSFLDKRFKETGHKNAYFPLFIPQSFIQKEAEHVEGFAPELATVTHAGGKELEEPLIVRPTSETIINHMFSKWISSHRDLPLLINQWANVVRWEMRTRLFLRTTEFLWQEGHTAHATKEEAVEETEKMIGVYAEFAENFMAMPVIQGLKSENERFAGAEETYCIEALMQDGKSLQAGTSHFLGQNFAKAFDVKFANKEGKQEFVWATSWGVSTRLMGALIMTHSDDYGLVLPPKLAPFQVVIVPIYKGDEELEKVTEVALKVKKSLEAKGISVKYDSRNTHKPGWKFAEYELKGVPLRLALGSRDIENGTIEIARRDTLEKETYQITDIAIKVENLLEQIQDNLYKKALTYREEKTFKADSKEEFVQLIKNGGFVYAHWDGTAETEELIKQETKATIRCVPLEGDIKSGTCIYSGNPSKQQVIFAKSY